ADEVAGGDARGEDRLVGVGAPGELADLGGGLLDGRGGVGGAEDGGLLPLPLDGVDGDDVAGARHGRPLHRVHADAAEADHHDRLAGLHVGGVDGGAPAGGHAAADQRGLVQRDPVVDLDGGRLVD